jgi:hypothetical protein
VKANHIKADQLADILTKSLGRAKFQEMRARIGLIHINSKTTHKAYGGRIERTSTHECVLKLLELFSY